MFVVSQVLCSVRNKSAFLSVKNSLFIVSPPLFFGKNGGTRKSFVKNNFLSYSPGPKSCSFHYFLTHIHGFTVFPGFLFRSSLAILGRIVPAASWQVSGTVGLSGGIGPIVWERGPG